MIRKCFESDFDTILTIINEAALAYQGMIPADRWHEPYMPQEYLQKEIDAGVAFWGWVHDEGLVAVMGNQDVQDVNLIRHAYTLSSHQRQGIGGKLLRFLCEQTQRPILIGTWAAADWAIAFYRKQGFRLVTEDEKDLLLQKYWDIPARQVETSVVLSNSSINSLL